MEITSAAMRALHICYLNMILSFLFLSLKLGIRSCVMKNLGWDDLFVTLSFLVSIPLTVSIYGRKSKLSHVTDEKSTLVYACQHKIPMVASPTGIEHATNVDNRSETWPGNARF